jgi:hypothetical protein
MGIRAMYKRSTNETGSEYSFNEIGYFNNISEAKVALRGLCPWDFNDMNGFSDYADFKFEETPEIKLSYKWKKERDNFIKEAKEHAKINTWHERSPIDWK